MIYLGDQYSMNDVIPVGTLIEVRTNDGANNNFTDYFAIRSKGLTRSEIEDKIKEEFKKKGIKSYGKLRISDEDESEIEFPLSYKRL